VQINVFFSLSDFSLNNWKSAQGLSPGQVLDVTMATRLIHDLAIAPYLLESSCDRTNKPYYPTNSKNWNKGGTGFCF